MIGYGSFFQCQNCFLPNLNHFPEGPYLQQLSEMNFWFPQQQLGQHLIQFPSFWTPTPDFFQTFRPYQETLHQLPSNSALISPQEDGNLKPISRKRLQSPKKESNDEGNQEKKSNCRNTKSMILRDFVKSLKKDPSILLLIKEKFKLKISVKSFIELLNQNIPDEGKYIRLAFFQGICSSKQEHQFALILRIMLKDFLSKHYKLFILNKKKKKLQYFKASRELSSKLFKSKEAFN